MGRCRRLGRSWGWDGGIGCSHSVQAALGLYSSCLRGRQYPAIKIRHAWLPSTVYTRVLGRVYGPCTLVAMGTAFSFATAQEVCDSAADLVDGFGGPSSFAEYCPVTAFPFFTPGHHLLLCQAAQHGACHR